jgi:hypothetical protein
MKKLLIFMSLMLCLLVTSCSSKSYKEVPSIEIASTASEKVNLFSQGYIKCKALEEKANDSSEVVVNVSVKGEDVINDKNVENAQSNPTSNQYVISLKEKYQVLEGIVSFYDSSYQPLYEEKDASSLPTIFSYASEYQLEVDDSKISYNYDTIASEILEKAYVAKIYIRITFDQDNIFYYYFYSYSPSYQVK